MMQMHMGDPRESWHQIEMVFNICVDRCDNFTETQLSQSINENYVEHSGSNWMFQLERNNSENKKAPDVILTFDLNLKDELLSP